MKRGLFTIIIALLAVTGAWAKETTHTVNNLIYKVVQPATGDMYAILSGYENSPEGILDIPGLIRVKVTTENITVPVTMIDEQAFIDREKITQVNIPSTIESIGNLAFNGCISLTSFNVNSKNANFCSENGILFNKAKTTLLQYPSAKADTDYSIPDGVTKIEDWAFYDCNKLTVMTIPSSVATIGEYALNFCTGLTKLFVHAKTPPTVGTNAFINVDLAIPVYVPAASLTAYKAAAGWKYFTNLQGWVTINNLNYKVIDPEVGNDYAILFGYEVAPQGALDIPEIINIPVGGTKHQRVPVTQIDEKALSKCNAITSVTIPDGITSIGKSAFEYCRNLTKVIIGNDVTTIKESAFYYCSSLKQVTIPASVTDISYNRVFGQCTALTQIDVESDNTAYCSEDGVLFNKNKTMLMRYPEGKPETSYIIPEGVTTIIQYAFESCKNLTAVIIPSSMTAIVNNAFFHCSSLNKVIVRATEPPGMGSNVFYAVDKSIPVYVPKESLDAYKTAAGWKEFTNLQALVTEFTVDKLKYDVTDLVANTVEITSGYGDGALNIPATVTYAGTEYKVTSIGAEAFYDCSFTSVTIPDGVTIIKYSAFQNCSELTEVTFGNSITTIENTAFYYCLSLKQVTIPKNVTKIGGNVFGFCTALTQVNVDAANTVYSSENGVLFNKNKTTLLRYPAAKPGTTYTVPKSVTCIGENAFGQCTALKELTLSENVSKIESYAFEDFAAITKMTVLATVPPTAETSAFKYFNLDTPVYVPASSLDAYKAANVWKEFTNLQAISGTAIDIPSMPESINIQGGTLHNPQGLTVNIYDLTGRLVYSGNATTVELPAGIYVVRCNGASRKVMF